MVYYSLRTDMSVWHNTPPMLLNASVHRVARECLYVRFSTNLGIFLPMRIS